LVPSSKKRYARRNPRSSGRRRIFRRFSRVSVNPTRIARAVERPPGRSGGRNSMAGREKSPNSAAAVRKAPP
jgi:hypothetical protein